MKSSYKFTIQGKVAGVAGIAHILVTGDGASIADNSGNSPDSANWTDFEANSSRIFSITNFQSGNGQSYLDVSKIELTNTVDFSITTNPAPFVDLK